MLLPQRRANCYLQIGYAPFRALGVPLLRPRFVFSELWRASEKPGCSSRHHAARPPAVDLKGRVKGRIHNSASLLGPPRMEQLRTGRRGMRGAMYFVCTSKTLLLKRSRGYSQVAHHFLLARGAPGLHSVLTPVTRFINKDLCRRGYRSPSLH